MARRIRKNSDQDTNLTINMFSSVWTNKFVFPPLLSKNSEI